MKPKLVGKRPAIFFGASQPISWAPLRVATHPQGTPGNGKSPGLHANYEAGIPAEISPVGKGWVFRDVLFSSVWTETTLE